MKKTSILLTILIVLVLAIMIFIGVNVSRFNKPYKALEADIVVGMKQYYGQDINLTKLPANNKTHKVTLKELKAFGIKINSDVNDDNCDGYGIVTGETLSHSYKAYIKCNKYTTKNYEKH